MHVQIIIGSVRAIRICDQIVSWVMNLLADLPGFTFELVDLRDWPLPMDAEPSQPKHGLGYLQSATRAWSAKIASGDAYVFLSPQYNWGYPAALKNALDHLYHEWGGKPALIVSYGARGGVKAAAQLREVLTGLHLHPTSADVNLFLRPDLHTPQGRLIDPATAFADKADTLRAGVVALTQPAQVG